MAVLCITFNYFTNKSNTSKSLKIDRGCQLYALLVWIVCIVAHLSYIVTSSWFREIQANSGIKRTKLFLIRANLIVRCTPANTRHWTNVGSMLGRRRRRRANIDPTLVQCLAFAGYSNWSKFRETVMFAILLWIQKSKGINILPADNYCITLAVFV